MSVFVCDCNQWCLQSRSQAICRMLLPKLTIDTKFERYIIIEFVNTSTKTSFFWFLTLVLLYFTGKECSLDDSLKAGIMRIQIYKKIITLSVFQVPSYRWFLNVVSLYFCILSALILIVHTSVNWSKCTHHNFSQAKSSLPAISHYLLAPCYVCYLNSRKHGRLN